MINSLANTTNKLALLLLQSKNYQKQSLEMVRQVSNQSKKPCYVCLNKPYAEVKEDLENERIPHNNITFVDAVSSHHYPLKPINNCVFVSRIEELNLLKKALNKLIEKNGYDVVIFDNITTLLIYKKPDEIIRFTHQLLSEKNQQKISKIFIVVKERGVYGEEITKLIKDLYLFADKVFEINNLALKDEVC